MTALAQSTNNTGGLLDIPVQGFVDGLQCSHWDRELLQQWRDGNLACVHVTVAIWEGTRDALRQVSQWNRWFREFSDLVAPARSFQDIVDVAASSRTAVILGFQNMSPFEDDLGMVEIFHDLGVRIAQMTYNIQNHVGASCYDPTDGGLTRFGRYVIREMNRVGMIVDLSHCGDRTNLDAIEYSERPVIASHANPAGKWPHPRNMSDDILRALADKGGLLGCAPYPHLTGGVEVTGRQWAEGVAYAVDLMGIDHVGIGSDSCHKMDYEDLMHIRMGYWSHEVQYGAGTPDQADWLPWPAYFRDPSYFPNLESSLAEVGFSPEERQKIMGHNLLRLYADGFQPGRTSA